MCVFACVGVYTARDKQRQCIASAVCKIFLAVAPFSFPATCYCRIPEDLRRGKTDTSRSKVRILFPETLLPRVFSSLGPPPPPPSGPFSGFFLSSFLFFSSFYLRCLSLYSALPSSSLSLHPLLSAERRNHASKL